jgi:hypothetical protein
LPRKFTWEAVSESLIKKNENSQESLLKSDCKIDMDQEVEGEYQTLVKDIHDCDAFEDVPPNVKVQVQTGKTFDLGTVNIRKHVPNTK